MYKFRCFRKAFAIIHNIFEEGMLITYLHRLYLHVTSFVSIVLKDVCKWKIKNVNIFNNPIPYVTHLWDNAHAMLLMYYLESFFQLFQVNKVRRFRKSFSIIRKILSKVDINIGFTVTKKQYCIHEDYSCSLVLILINNVPHFPMIVLTCVILPLTTGLWFWIILLMQSWMHI